MAWNEPGGNNQDPWGGGNRGNNQGPPDLDEALKKFQEKLGGIFGSGGGRGGQGKGFSSATFGLIIAVLLLIYGFAGIKVIDEQERAVVLRLGVYDRTLSPGLNWAPPLVDKVYTVNVTRVRFHEVKSISMLTQDLNIVEVDLTVQYNIANAEDFVLNVRDPETSLREATDSALRHEVGSAEMHEVLTEGRGELAILVAQRLQEYLDSYKAGMSIGTVNIQETTPPRAVQDAFDDVNRAREDEERAINEAQAYSNGIIPEARGQAQRVIEEANGYRDEVVARAQGEADRFAKLLVEYKKAPQVTRERLYLDAVQDVMQNSSKVLVDVEGGNNMMYLPLDKLTERATRSSGGASAGLTANEIAEMEKRILEQLRRETSNNNTRWR
ncbi:FtsH protease activity modulator HflK [Aurantivibrio plasticivorans]